MRKTAEELLAEADHIDAEHSALEAVRAPMREFASTVVDFVERAFSGIASVRILSISIDSSGARELGFDRERIRTIATPFGHVRIELTECGPGADPWQDRAVRLARIVTAIDIEQLRGRPETFDVRSLVCDSRLIVSLSPSGELEWKP